MIHYRYYLPHRALAYKNTDDNIYTFDIESTSYYILNGKIHNMSTYLDLTQAERDECIFGSCMYIWQFSINGIVYYGRTWDEFLVFLNKLNESVPLIKIVYIHNLSFEFNFLKSVLSFDEVFARKSRKPIYAINKRFNIEFRCSYFLTNCALENLPEVYNLNVNKKTGFLAYDKLRHHKTELTHDEMLYCEYDCIVLYSAIKKEKDRYKHVKNIPLTATGHVRRALKKHISKSNNYKYKTQRAINTDPHVYNLLVKMFTGGYTHANCIYTDTVIYDVDSYDFSSSYPFVMCTCQFPSKEFKPCYIKSVHDISTKFAYILKVKFADIKSKCFHSFISHSKCINITGGLYDNGRVVQAKSLEIILTDVDFRFICKSHDFSSVEFVETYYAPYNYLPIEFVNFILSMYNKKTELKGVEGRELEYALTKSQYNSLFGMSVTNTIKDEVNYDDITKTWNEQPITNNEIVEKLNEEKEKAFMSFATGVWITSHARNNLLECAMKFDEFSAYEDTDSLKLVAGYDKSVIDDYNKKVLNNIDNVCYIRDIDRTLFSPTDIKGKAHTMGLFEFEYTYDEFITQGAKKYAYKIGDDIHITVAGVPKKARKSLKKLDDFRDGYVFKYEDTNKLILQYVEEQPNRILTDYKGVTVNITDRSGVCLIPTTYTLGKALEYAEYVADMSSRRAIYKE